MENPRPEKVAIVTEVKERLEQSSSVLVTEYRGLSVKALAELRRELRPAGGAYKVYKNTLVRRAAAEAGVDLSEHLVGPTALAFTETTPEGDAGDIVSVAKVLKDFAKTNPNLVVKGGLLEGEPIDAAGIGRLADLEPREVQLAKLAGLMAAPMQQFANLLQALPRNFAYGLQALIDQGGATEAAPEPDGAPAPSSDEAPSGADGASDEAPSGADGASDEAPSGADDSPTEETPESANTEED